MEVILRGRKSKKELCVFSRLMMLPTWQDRDREEEALVVPSVSAQGEHALQVSFS